MVPQKTEVLVQIILQFCDGTDHRVSAFGWPVATSDRLHCFVSVVHPGAASDQFREGGKNILVLNTALLNLTSI